MTDMRLVGLDLALGGKTKGGCGVAWTHDQNGQPSIGCETIHPGSRVGEERVMWVLNGIAARCRAKPALVAIEGPAFAVANKASLWPLAGLRGCVRLWLHTKKIPFVEISPGTLKVWATGRGDMSGENKVTKEDVYKAIVAEYGRLCHIGDDNAADAMAAMSLAAHAYADPLTKVYNPTRLRAVDGVREWPRLGEVARG